MHFYENLTPFNFHMNSLYTILESLYVKKVTFLATFKEIY